MCCLEVLATPHGQVALGDPRCRTVADRGELLEAALRVLEHLLRLFELLLLGQSPAEAELGVADLVEVVDPAAQKIECVPRLLLRELRLARAPVKLRKGPGDWARDGVIARPPEDAQ